MTDKFPYEAEVQLLGYAWNPDDGPWARVRFDSDVEMSGGPHPFHGLPKGREKGQRFRIRFDLIADDETTTAEPSRPANALSQAPTVHSSPDTEGWSEAKRRMVQQSGIVRKEQAFQYWLYWAHPNLWATAQREYPDDKYQVVCEVVHTICNVDSCADLDPSGASGRAWERLVSDYRNSQKGWTEEDQQRQRDRI